MTFQNKNIKTDHCNLSCGYHALCNVWSAHWNYMNKNQLAVPVSKEDSYRCFPVCGAALLLLILIGIYSVRPEAVTAKNFQTGNSFEGKIGISRYSVSADGEEKKISAIQLLIHSENLLLENEEEGVIDLMGNIRAEKVLVRQNREDFVFFTTSQQAVIMNRQELQQMVNMLENLRGENNNRQVDSPEMETENTGENSTIDGYSATKWIAGVPDRVAEWHVWITDEISIPWGMLSESWLTGQTFLSGLPAEEWLSDDSLPIRAELWNGGQLVEVLKIEDITREIVDESNFTIPDHYQRLNFQQMLFDRMRNR